MMESDDDDDGRENSIAATSTSTARRVTCVNCRTRHRKCDDHAEQCRECETSQLVCVRRTGLRFRVKSSPIKFPRGQTWLAIPQQLSFVEDSHLLEDISTNRDGDRGVLLDGESGRGSLELHLLNSSVSETTNSEGLDSLGSPATAITSGFPTPPPTSEPYLPSQPESDKGLHTSSVLYLQITISREAYLFHHYIDNLLVWFDFDDPQQIFRREVIQKVTSCDMLLRAIYALTSRQLSNLGRFDPAVTETYHEECMSALIQALEPSSAVVKDQLFAATVILRTKEEFDTTCHGSDSEAHLLGIKSITNSAWFDQEPSPLRQRLYWIALRQEISFALVKQRPLDINLNLSFTTGPFDLSSETEWASCVALNLAKIILFAFDEKPKTKERYLLLQDSTSELAAATPLSFRPFYESTTSEDESELAFPRILISSNFGSFFTQHLIICRLFLACFDPTLPKIGPGSYFSAQKKTKEMVHLLRRLCGIGMSQSKFGPCMILACTGASICGDRFSDESHRETIMEILIRTEREHAYPTAAIQKGLLEAWSIP